MIHRFFSLVTSAAQKDIEKKSKRKTQFVSIDRKRKKKDDDEKKLFSASF